MGGGTDGEASMRYQHTNTSHQATSHNRSSGFSSVAEIAGGMGLRSPQPQQLALDFAPAQVRSHGLRDAHTYPQVARGQGASFRVPASQAWGYPSLELRAGNSWPLMGFDCDVPEKVLDALVSNHWGARSDAQPALPEPNMIVQRRSNSHSHVSYFLAKPVHRGPTAREAPLRLFARISEFYRQALGADPGYNGVLTHNPMRSAHRHGEFLTHWGCNRPYSLSELAEPIPRGWRLPVKPTTEADRNCALFVALMKWAGSPANIGREVVAVARATNDGLDVPLGDSEVAGLAKSVERYRRSWIAKGRFYTEAEREAWGCALGLRSGLARRKGSNEELRLWEAEGIHRAMWYRRRGEGNAARIAARNKSIREDPRINAELASEHGLTVRQIQRIRNQLGGGVTLK